MMALLEWLSKKYIQMGNLRKLQMGVVLKYLPFLMGLIFIVKSLVEGLILELLMIVISSKKVQMSYSDWR